jgi:hypothetical protein
MENALLVTHLSWQGGAVLGLLFLSILLAQWIKAFPKDLIFTFGALLTSLVGVVSSKELYNACTSEAIRTVLGLWMIGKACEQQGLFHAIILGGVYKSFCSLGDVKASGLNDCEASCINSIQLASQSFNRENFHVSPNCKNFCKRPLGFMKVKKENMLSRKIFFLQIVLVGAFFHHRYFTMATLRLLAQRFEKADSSVLGFPFAYLLLVGGFTTAIGTSSNIIFFSLYSIAVPEALSQFFVFLPLAILPILLTLLVLTIFHKVFRKVFPQFLETYSCAIVPPDSLRIGKPTHVTILREGWSLSTHAKLASGDLLLFAKGHTHFLELIAFSPTMICVKWKAWVTLFLFLAAIVATVFSIAIGTAFFIASLLLLLFHPFSLKRTFRDEFPLPLLLEIFSATIFFTAMLNSGLSGWLASFINWESPFYFLVFFFFCSQIVAHFMTRPLAFAALFSIVFFLFSGYPAHLLIAGANIAFASAVPLFGRPKTDEIAIAQGISGRSPLGIRLTLIIILFAGLVIPSCLFW